MTLELPSSIAPTPCNTPSASLAHAASRKHPIQRSSPATPTLSAASLVTRMLGTVPGDLSPSASRTLTPAVHLACSRGGGGPPSRRKVAPKTVGEHATSCWICAVETEAGRWTRIIWCMLSSFCLLSLALEISCLLHCFTCAWVGGRGEGAKHG